jgi:hypothetical protein
MAYQCAFTSACLHPFEEAMPLSHVRDWNVDGTVKAYVDHQLSKSNVTKEVVFMDQRISKPCEKSPPNLHNTLSH